MQDLKDGSIYMGPDENRVGREMPRYRCHKEVWALKIKTITFSTPPNADGTNTGSAVITPVEEDYLPFPVDSAYVTKHQPKIGGYFVVYNDGYTSFSPAQAFESGYTRIK